MIIPESGSWFEHLFVVVRLGYSNYIAKLLSVLLTPHPNPLPRGARECSFTPSPLGGEGRDEGN
jgi:hypothetical protein